jgi:pre-rRNA-processing protein TSR2
MNSSEPSGINAPSPTSVLFARGVIARLASWPVLQIAIEQGWGGPHGIAKRRWLASVIVDAFEEQDPTPDAIYVEEMLLQVMEDEYETTVEDSSVGDVAGDVVRIWEEVHRGRQDIVLRFEEQADKLQGKKIAVQEFIHDEEWEDEEEEDSSGDETAPTLIDHTKTPRKENMEVDDDGFTMVKGKGKGQR